MVRLQGENSIIATLCATEKTHKKSRVECKNPKFRQVHWHFWCLHQGKQIDFCNEKGFSCLENWIEFTKLGHRDYKCSLRIDLSAKSQLFLLLLML